MKSVLVSVRYEVARWTRTRFLLALVAWFAVSGLVSPLTVRYAEQLFGAANPGANIRISISTGGWGDALDSYFKNASQVSLLLAVVLVAHVCAVSARTDIGIFYVTRLPAGRSALHLLVPRIVVAAIAVALAAVVGAGCCVYETAILFPRIDLGRALTALVVEAVALLLICVVAGAAAALLGRALPAAALVLTAYFVSAIFGARTREWSPSRALRPSEILHGGPVPAFAVLVLAVLGAVLVVAVHLRPFRTATTFRDDVSRPVGATA